MKKNIIHKTIQNIGSNVRKNSILEFDTWDKRSNSVWVKENKIIEKANHHKIIENIKIVQNDKFLIIKFILEIGVIFFDWILFSNFKEFFILFSNIKVFLSFLKRFFCSVY